MRGVLAAAGLLVLGQAAAGPGGERRRLEPVVVGDHLVTYSSTTDADAIWFTYEHFNGLPSLRINATAGKERTADFRLVTLRLIEVSAEHPAQASNSTYEFRGKGAWGPIHVDTLTTRFRGEDVQVVRLNSTFVQDRFAVSLAAYIADRPALLGDYNLDPAAACVVPVIAGFPYRYAESAVALEQVVVSRGASGPVNGYLQSSGGTFRGSLAVGPQSQDSALGPLQNDVGSLEETELDYPVSGEKAAAAGATGYQRLFVSLGDKQQPQNVTLQETFAVNLDAVAREGSGLDPTMPLPGSLLGGGGSHGLGATSAASPGPVVASSLLVALVAAITATILFL